VSLIVGEADQTAFRADTAPEAVRPNIQKVPAAAETAIRSIPRGRLVRLPGLGHAPQVEDPARFVQALMAELAP